MRFAAVAAFVGAAVALPELQERGAGSTVTATAIQTIYSCPPGVPSSSCPYAQAAATPVNTLTTSVVSSVIVHTITACPSTVTNCPARLSTQTIELYTTVCPVSEAAVTPVAPKPTTSSIYVAPVELSYITKTTCVPSTWVETVTVSKAPVPTYSAKPTGPANATVSALPTYTPAVFRGAASSLQGSIVAAGVIALGAILFA